MSNSLFVSISGTNGSLRYHPLSRKAVAITLVLVLRQSIKRRSKSKLYALEL